MKILLVGESSLLHNTLKKGLVELGHQVTLMSDGNDWHNSPRDIDLHRNMERYGRWSGLIVLWKIVCNLHKICGNDIVQVHNYQFVPLMGWWNMLIFWFLKLTNKRIIKGCFADDPHLFRQQAKGIPAYSDTFGMVNYRISRRIKSVWLFILCLSLISAGILYLIILML